MPHYQIHGYDRKSGQKVTGIVEAATEADAVQSSCLVVESVKLKQDPKPHVAPSGDGEPLSKRIAPALKAAIKAAKTKPQPIRIDTTTWLESFAQLVLWLVVFCATVVGLVSQEDAGAGAGFVVAVLAGVGLVLIIGGVHSRNRLANIEALLRRMETGEKHGKNGAS